MYIHIFPFGKYFGVVLVIKELYLDLFPFSTCLYFVFLNRRKDKFAYVQKKTNVYTLHGQYSIGFI